MAAYPPSATAGVAHTTANRALLAAAAASKPRSISVRAAGVVAVDIVPVDLVAIDVVPVNVVPVDGVAIDVVPIDVVNVYVIPPHNRISIQVGAVTTNVAVDDCPIDVNVPITVIDVEVAIDVHIDERSVNTNPTAANPSVVIDSAPAPIPVVIEPCSNR